MNQTWMEVQIPIPETAGENTLSLLGSDADEDIDTDAITRTSLFLIPNRGSFNEDYENYITY
jgi:hypothetical protein